jgi:hypothetical protein
MDRLPKEIVLLIIEDFTYKEKLACALVCQKWLVWIRDSSLYRTLCFSNGCNTLTKAIEYFDNRNYRNHVSNLEINGYDLDLNSFSQLPDLFPNLKQFRFTVDDHIYELEDTFTSELTTADLDLQIQKWRNLEVIIEMNNRLHPITLALLHSPNNVRLTSISLSIFKRDTSKALLRVIHNAPVLESLTVDGITLSIQNLDYLMENTPQLKSLAFHNLYIDLDDDNDEVEENFSQPRNNIENVVIMFFDTIMANEIDQWIDYLSIYTSITSLTILPMDSLPPLLDTVAIESSLIDAFSNWNLLRKYNMGFVPLTEQILEVMADNHIEIEDMTMHINLIWGQIEWLASSTQAQNIRSLQISGEYSSHVQDSAWPFSELMNRMVNLDTLKITCDGLFNQSDPNLIIRLMHNAPNVKHMVIPNLTQEPPMDDPLPADMTSQLTHLDIDYCQFDFSKVDSDIINASFDSVLQCCPYLESFDSNVNIYNSIYKTCVGRENTLKFRFNNHRSLKKIRIRSLYSAFFKIITNGSTKYYKQSTPKIREEIDCLNEGCSYITIEADNEAIIETIVLDP